MWLLAGPLAVVAGVIGAFSTTLQRPGLLLLLVLVVPVPLVVRARQGKLDFLEPIALFVIGFLAIYVARPLAQVGYNQTDIGPGLYTFPGLNQALLIALVGVIAVYVGYALPAGRRVVARARALPGDWDSETAAFVSLGIILFGLLLWSVFLAQAGGLSELQAYIHGRSASDPGAFQNSSGYFYLGPFVAIPAALILLETNAKRRSLLLVLAGILAVAFVLLITVPRGDRTFILVLVLPLIAQRALRTGRRPRVATVVVAAVVGIFVVTVLVQYRRVETRQGSLPQAFGHAAVHPAEELKAFLLGSDTEMFPLMTVLVDQVHGHVPFTTVTSLLASPIPGSLWPGKPRDPDTVFYRTEFPTEAAITNSGNALSVVGSYWYDGGYIGLVVYGVLTGILFRALWEYRLRFPQNRGVRLFYAACLPYVIVLIRGNPTESFGPALFTVAPILACLWLSAPRDWAFRSLARPPS